VAAPENAPFLCPNSSLSIRLGGTAPQLTATIAPVRPDRAWMARASTSLPVPVSPSINTGTIEPAMVRSLSRSRLNSGDSVARPAIGSGLRSRSMIAASPSASTARLVGRPPTNVPFFESVSVTSQRPKLGSKRAWRDDIQRSGTRIKSSSPTRSALRAWPRPITIADSPARSKRAELACGREHSRASVSAGRGVGPPRWRPRSSARERVEPRLSAMGS
jgi:hypothetical protein